MNSLNDVISAVGGLISGLTSVALGVALLIFLWGLAKFILKAHDPKENESGKNLMKWGLIALFVMVSYKGIVLLLQGEIGL